MRRTQFIRLEGISNDPVYVQMPISGERLSMEVDSRAEVSIISEKSREKIFPEEKLRPSVLKLNTYSNESMR